MTIVLQEGMREGDLADLVLPLISVDEYSSKVSADEAIVVGFYVQEEAAAKDLNRFLQKSAAPILGTEVSPAPDQHGFFMVFVEMMDNDQLAENLESVLQEIAGLVKIDEWQLRVRGSEEVLPYSTETLERGLRKAKRDTKKSEVVEFLQRSYLHNAGFEDDVLILEAAGERLVFDFVEFGRINTILRDYRLDEAGVRCDIRSVAKTNKITRLLGEHWDAAPMGRYYLLTNAEDVRALLVKL
jgi:hypothetical protein